MRILHTITKLLCNKFIITRIMCLLLTNNVWFIKCNTQCPTQVLKRYSIEIHRRHGHKNTPTLRNLITSATDSLSSLIIFTNCDDATVYYIIVKYEATNMTSVTGKYISGTAINSETE